MAYCLINCRSQWPRGLRHVLSSLARALESWVQIPLKEWMSVYFYSLFVLIMTLPDCCNYKTQNSVFSVGFLGNPMILEGSVVSRILSLTWRCLSLESTLIPSHSFWLLLAESESYVTTDGQSAGLSWNKAPIWGLRPDLYYCQTVADLLMWGALSDERTGLSFTIAAGPRQCSHSRVRVPLDSWPYFTVSDSPPTTRRATVEVYDPASTRELTYQLVSFYSC
jgi:hypothetical protein